MATENMDVVDLDLDADDEKSFGEQPDGTDWSLAWIISNAEKTGLAPALTLFVGGTLISGQLITAHDYFTQLEKVAMNATINGVTDEDALNTFQKAIAMSFGSSFNVLFPETGSEKAGGGSYGYIHLKNAKVISPAGSIPNQGLLWRGKLAAVDGFSIGELRVD